MIWIIVVLYVLAAILAFLTLNALGEQGPYIFPLIVAVVWPLFLVVFFLMPVADFIRQWLSDQASQPELLALREENKRLRLILEGQGSWRAFFVPPQPSIDPNAPKA